MRNKFTKCLKKLCTRGISTEDCFFPNSNVTEIFPSPEVVSQTLWALMFFLTWCFAWFFDVVSTLLSSATLAVTVWSLVSFLFYGSMCCQVFVLLWLYILDIYSVSFNCFNAAGSEDRCWEENRAPLQRRCTIRHRLAHRPYYKDQDIPKRPE